MKGLCIHRRALGHVCLDCPTGTASMIAVDDIVGTNAYIDGELQPKMEGATYVITGNDPCDPEWEETKAAVCPDSFERQATGLDAPYYDIPANVTCVQDAVEYLGLNFANGNILKSLWREHGTQTKETDALYEAQKRYYFAAREYERVSGMPCKETARLRGTHDVEEKSK